MPKSTSTNISDQVELRIPGIVVKAYNVANVRSKHRKDNLGLYTPTQYFLYKLESGPDIVYKVHREGDQPIGQIDSIFWIYQWCIKRWKQNPHTLSFNNTYSINQFNIPLFQVTSITEVHTTFNISFCLLNGERQANFAWALRNLRALAVEEDIPDLFIAISNYNKAFKNAASSVFPKNMTKH